MYMWVTPDIRSAMYQAAKAAGIQRQSGTPANHKFTLSDSAKRAVSGHGAAFIIARNPSMPGAWQPFASTAPGMEPLGLAKNYWRNMREASLVQPLIAGAHNRELEMTQASVV